MRSTKLALVASLLATYVGSGCSADKIIGPIIRPPDGPEDTVPTAPPDHVQMDSIVYQDPATFELKVVALDGTNNHRLTGTGNGPKGWPSFSPSGDTMLFVGEGVCGPQTAKATLFNGSGTPWEIMKLDANGQCPTQGAWVPTMSPDGKCVAFITGWMDETYTSAAEICGNADPQRLLSGVSPYTPIYSHDGQEIIVGAGKMVQTQAGDSVLWYSVVALNRANSSERKLWSDVASSGDPSAILPSSIYDMTSNGAWVSAVGLSSRRGLIIRTDGSGEWRYVTPPDKKVKVVFFCKSDEWAYYVPTDKLTSLRKVDLMGQNDQEVFNLTNAVNMPRCRRAD